MEIGTKIYCINEFVYNQQLTKGKEYFIHDLKEGQFQIRSNQDKLSWFPDSCFSFEEVPQIVAIHLDDKIKDPKNDSIEVMIEFSNGDKRWTTFFTTAYLDTLLKSNSYLVFPKAVIVEELTESKVKETIVSLDKQNELIAVSQIYS